MNLLISFIIMIIGPALALCLALIGLETRDENILGWFLLVFGIVYPVGSVIYYIKHREPLWKSTDGSKILETEKGAVSFWTILPGLLVCFIAPPLEWLYLSAILPRVTWLQTASLILIIIAVVLCIWTWLHDRWFTSLFTRTMQAPRLVKSGPYHFIRHPGYTSLVLIALGLAIGYSSLIGLVAIPTLLIPGIIFRIMIEERILNELFPDEYQDYQHRTKRLFPFLW